MTIAKAPIPAWTISAYNAQRIVLVPTIPIVSLNTKAECPVSNLELNVCVECLDDSQCPEGDTCLVAICPDPIPGGFDECGNPLPPIYGTGTLVNECVECLDDSDCDDRLDRS